ncbi:hypothetical protein Mal4_33010 [Maioricimonas rarisocia]|uniref:Uncharacterized protein n=1 Tax=Maioricimonas rarisocia TaxID=2528026 RepID=A0A517Z949_9PLAN|nr:permease prefix domain 1-containing protein [Maioricimonas rarisocia]QDU38969.1 hypothetical protein Mal4_33010 [Maioricimonas rarisocia]
MNSMIQRSLMAHIERAVRPLPIGHLKRRRIREELLTHLEAIYAEEMQGGDSAAEAVERALRRFGSPESLSRELLASVTFADRVNYVIEKLSLGPDETVWHFLGKQLAISTLYWGVPLSAVMLLKGSGDLLVGGDPSIRVLATVILVSTLFTTLFLWTTDRISRAFFVAASDRSTPQAIRLATGSLATVPVVMLLAHGLLGIGWPSGMTLTVYVVLAPVVPLASALMARNMADKICHEEEWRHLDASPVNS